MEHGLAGNQYDYIVSYPRCAVIDFEDLILGLSLSFTKTYGCLPPPPSFQTVWKSNNKMKYLGSEKPTIRGEQWEGGATWKNTIASENATNLSAPVDRAATHETRQKPMRTLPGERLLQRSNDP